MSLPVKTTFFALVALFALRISALATYKPGPSYTIALPSNSSSSAADGNGDIFIQIRATSSYPWVAIGTGSQMAGAHMLIMYSDGNGSVTVSGRLGTGHREPQVDPDLQVEVLAGSRDAGDTRLANIRCVGCARYLESTTDTASKWIAAWKESGDTIDSMDANADLSQHDEHRNFNIDLTQATVDTGDANPFLGAASETTSSTSDSSSGADSSSGSDAGSSSGSDADSSSGLNPNSTSGGVDDGDGDSSSSAVTETGGNGDATGTVTYGRAHGIMMAIAVLVLFPVGALTMPLLGSAIVHGGVQLLSLAVFIAAIGLGLHLADITQQMFNNTHTRFGIAILVLFVLQALGGAIHHGRHRKQLVSPRRTLARGHRWLGRSIVVLAVVNGGLGLKLAGAAAGYKIAWGVVAGVMALIWAVVVIVMALRERKQGKQAAGGKGEDAIPAADGSSEERVLEPAAAVPSTEKAA